MVVVVVSPRDAAGLWDKIVFGNMPSSGQQSSSLANPTAYFFFLMIPESDPTLEKLLLDKIYQKLQVMQTAN